jgi:hypothetical protein
MPNEMIERAKTNSWAGIFCNPGITVFDGPMPNNLTKKLTTKKDRPDKTI